MAHQSGAPGARRRHHFSAIWSLILHRRVVFLTFYSRSKRACHPERRRREGSAVLRAPQPAGPSRWFLSCAMRPQAGPSLARVPHRRVVFPTFYSRSKRACHPERRRREGPPERRRREGSAVLRAPDPAGPSRRFPSCAMRPQAGPSLARVRALAQDDNARPGL